MISQTVGPRCFKAQSTSGTVLDSKLCMRKASSVKVRQPTRTVSRLNCIQEFGRSSGNRAGLSKCSAALDFASASISPDQNDQASISGQAEVETGEVLGNATFLQAVMNVLNILMGVGILTLPVAFSKAGWAGLGVLWCLGIITNYTGKVLVDCHEAVAESLKKANGLAGHVDEGGHPLKIGYEEIGQVAFGGFGRILISWTMYIELLGTCALLFILEGDNFFHLLGTSIAPNAGGYMLLSALMILPTVWLPDLKSLSYLGFVGLAATVTVAATIGYTLITGSYAAGAVTQMANLSTLPLIFGIMAFVYAGHGVFPSIRASMKEPQHFPKVLNVAYLIVGSLCTFIGGAGYYMYGKGVRDVITFNLPPGILSIICSVVVLVNPIAKFALTMEPPAAAFTAFWSRFSPGVPVLLRRAVLRSALVFCCLAVARFMPFLALVMALIGSFLTIGVSIVFPVACHLKLFHGRLPRRQVIWDWVVLAVGVICALSGTSASILSLSRAVA